MVSKNNHNVIDSRKYNVIDNSEEVQAILQEIQAIEEEICLAEEEGDTYGVILSLQEKRALEEELETLRW